MDAPDHHSGRNRDVFWLAMVIAAMFMAVIIVLGIIAWNLRVMLMPVIPRDPAAHKTLLSCESTGWMGRFAYVEPRRAATVLRAVQISDAG